MFIRLLLCFALSACAFSQDKPGPLTPEDIERFIPIKDWFSIEVDGTYLGYLTFRIEPAEYRGQPSFVYTGEAAFALGSHDGGPSSYIKSRHYFEAEPPYRLLAYEYEEKEINQEPDHPLVTASYLCDTNGCILTAGGSTKPIDRLDFTLADHLGIYRWIAEGRSVGDRLESKTLDETKGGVLTYTAEIDIVRDSSEISEGEPAYELTAYHPVNEMKIHWSAQGQMLAVEMEDAFTAEVTDQATIEQQNEQFAETFRNDTLLEGNIDDIPSIEVLTLGFDASAKLRLPNTPRQQFEAEGPNGQSVVKVRGSKGIGMPTTEEDMQAALTASAPDEAVAEKLKAILAGLSTDGGMPDADDLLTFTYQWTQPDKDVATLNLPEIFSGEERTNGEFVDLFTGLTNLAGIPSREVTGLLYYGVKGHFISYVWAEVAVNGTWQEVDPYLGYDRVTPVHVRCGTGTESGLKALALAKMPIKVLSVERRGSSAADAMTSHTLGDFGASLSLSSDFRFLPRAENDGIKQFASPDGVVVVAREVIFQTGSEEELKTLHGFFEASMQPSFTENLYQKQDAAGDAKVLRGGYLGENPDLKFAVDIALVSLNTVHYVLVTLDTDQDVDRMTTAADKAIAGLSFPEDDAWSQVADLETLSFGDDYSDIQFDLPTSLLVAMEDGEYLSGYTDALEQVAIVFFWNTGVEPLGDLIAGVKDVLTEELGPLTDETIRDFTISGYPAREATWQVPDSENIAISIVISLPRDEWAEFRYVGAKALSSHQDIFDRMAESIEIEYSDPETDSPEADPDDPD